MKLRSPLPARRNRLEIIPLIDIMFFLLASFMLVSLTLSRQQTIRVNLPPATSTTAAGSFQPDQINLAVDAVGRLHLDTRAVTLPELETALAARHQPGTAVYISGDQDARHGAMITLLEAVRRAGFQKVAFQVRPGGAPSVP